MFNQCQLKMLSLDRKYQSRCFYLRSSPGVQKRARSKNLTRNRSLKFFTLKAAIKFLNLRALWRVSLNNGLTSSSQTRDRSTCRPQRFINSPPPLFCGFGHLSVGKQTLLILSGLGVPKPGCFKPGCFLRSLHLRSFALICGLLRSFALFCGLAFALFCGHLRSFADSLAFFLRSSDSALFCTHFCVFLQTTAFRTTASGNSIQLAEWGGSMAFRMQVAWTTGGRRRDGDAACRYLPTPTATPLTTDRGETKG